MATGKRSNTGNTKPNHKLDLGKNIAACTLSLALISGCALPAFAVEADSLDTLNQIEKAPAAEAPSTAASDSSNSETPENSSEAANNADAPASTDAPAADTATAPRPDAVASGTVALSGAGEAPKPENTVSAPTSENTAQDEPADTELCTWTTDGRTWSTTRGGKAMTVTNAYAFGIDVSQWQGDIDWARVKAAGVQYAIIRCGYGAENTGEMDYKFLQNVAGCKENGIPFGIYLYAIASDPAGATAEANQVLRLLDLAGVTPSDLSYPVYYDMESENQRATDHAGRGQMAENFCTIIAEAGFTPGIYASHYWFSSLLTDPRFDNYTKWVASYPGEGAVDAHSSYLGAHDMWQCMSRGVVDGINGRVDIDFDYHFVEANYGPIYDYDHYVANNPDVAETYGDDRHATFYHFLDYGMDEGRESSPTFNLHGYFNSNPDLRAAFGLDLKQYYLHYLNSGLAEGRSYQDSRIPIGLVKGFGIRDLSRIYDPYVYLMQYPDLEATYTKTAFGQKYIDDNGLFRHFLSTGLVEGRFAK